MRQGVALLIVLAWLQNEVAVPEKRILSHSACAPTNKHATMHDTW